MNQVAGRLQRLEADALGSGTRGSTILALLVELVSAGWTSVDERLARLESVVAQLEQSIQANHGAIVYRMEDRRHDAATS